MKKGEVEKKNKIMEIEEWRKMWQKRKGRNGEK